jgi:acyl-CoA synthetase (AMP-forming)/AMP-acid ligase II
LTFRDDERLDPELRTAFLGPGGPFEFAREQVLGVEVPVHVGRAPELRTALARAADAHGDRPALVDRVALAGRTSFDHAVCLWGVVAAGAVAVELNAWWTPAELADGRALTRPSLVLADDDLASRVDDAASASGTDVVGMADLVAGAASAELDDHVIDEDDPAAILFTSGTTGRAKGAVLSHRNVVHFGSVALVGGAVATFLGAGSVGADQPAALCVSPLFHISGATPLLANGPLMGMKLVFPDPGRWDAGVHLELTERHRITSWSGVPTQVWRLLEHPDIDRRDLDCVGNVGIGGAPFSPELQARVLERFPTARLTNGYGMTETTGTGTWLTGERIVAHPSSVGAATPGQEVQVRDGSGRPLPAGEVGEICIRGAGVFLGYLDDDEATAAVLDEGRWYRTGDFGRIEDDVLYLESRMRDLIIRGGENVYPLEIEHRLTAHPDVVDATVVGVDHPALGQEVRAVVVARPGSELDAEAVRAWAAETLAPFKVPAVVDLVDTLPYTATGKVQKHLL